MSSLAKGDTGSTGDGSGDRAQYKRGGVAPSPRKARLRYLTKPNARVGHSHRK
jgi:hypothetical protein